MSQRKLLVIIEAPRKVNKIKEIFKSAVGDSFSINVMATKGHLFNLPTNSLGITNEGAFFISLDPSRINNIKVAADKADLILVASDPDREGEAIAWELRQILAPLKNRMERIKMFALSAEACEQALSASDKTFDENAARAALSRRFIDRLIGFNLSREAMHILGRGASIGRVKSVILRYVNQVPWTPVYTGMMIIAHGFDGVYACDVVLKNGFFHAKNNKQMRGWLKASKVGDIVVRHTNKQFTTAGFLAKAALSRGNGIFESLRASSALQSMYERGYISYPRTRDNVLSTQGLELARVYLDQPDLILNTSMSPSGHECIRPIQVNMPGDLSLYERRIYDMIKNNFILSVQNNEIFSADAKAKINGNVFDAEFSSDDKFVLNILKTDMSGYSRFRPSHSNYRTSELFHWMERSRVGSPSTYANSLYELFEKNYISSSVRVTAKGKKNLSWLEQYAPWLTEETTRQLEKLLDQISMNLIDFREAFRMLQDVSHREFLVPQRDILSFIPSSESLSPFIPQA